MSNIKPKTFESVRWLLKAKTVECRHDKQLAWDVPGVAERCDDCRGRGQMPDPIYAPLAALFNLDCSGKSVEGMHLSDCAKCELEDCTCCCKTCSGTVCSGFITRFNDWWKVPEGALAGAIHYEVAKELGESSWFDLLGRVREKMLTLYPDRNVLEILEIFLKVCPNKPVL